jgi:hypothetical protein
LQPATMFSSTKSPLLSAHSRGDNRKSFSDRPRM